MKHYVTETGIETAIRLAGGERYLAKHLGVSQQRVNQCKQRGYMPVEHAVATEALTGVDRRKLVDPKLLVALGLAPLSEAAD